MYEQFVYWLSCLSMEETFLFSYISAIVIGVAIGIPLAILDSKNSETSD